MDEHPPLPSPVSAVNEHSLSSVNSPPTLESFANTGLKILSKGSKKWLGEQPLQIIKSDIYQHDQNARKGENATDISLDVGEPQTFDRTKLNMSVAAYSRHESSNASLLVEAALDSVTDIHCPESNINIDVDHTGGADALVNNLCSLTNHDNLGDVSYSHSVDITETREINLISPVNDNISVADDLNNLNSELRQSDNIGIDYSTFHQDDFSPNGSPNVHHRAAFVRDYINVNHVSPHDVQNYDTNNSKTLSPVGSPPRYNFGHSSSADHLSSDDSNGIGAQNLSLHGSKGDEQLDLSIYKSSYNMETPGFQLRKDFRMKLNIEPERKQVYVLEVSDLSKSYGDNPLNDESKFNLSDSSEQIPVDGIESSSLCDKDFENIDNSDMKHKISDSDNSLRVKYHDSNLGSNERSKQFDMDVNLRTKNYDISTELFRNRSSYDATLDLDFRIKNYDVESLEIRNKSYDNVMDPDFRSDRNFEPLVLNSTELQGLDMSARSYHSYSSSTVQNLNRYHHLYPDVERPSVDLRLNYSPPAPSYTHADVLRVVSLDLTSPGRHSVDLSLRSNALHAHQIASSRLLSEHGLQTNRLLTDHNRLTLDQSRLLSTELTSNRHLNTNSRLLSVSDTGNRILSDHSTNRLLSNDQISSNHLISSEQRLLTDESRLITDQSRLIEQGRLLTEGRLLPPTGGNGSISPVPYAGYSVSPTPYHPTPISARSHATSPSPPYHHYSTYY